MISALQIRWRVVQRGFLPFIGLMTLNTRLTGRDVAHFLGLLDLVFTVDHVKKMIKFGSALMQIIAFHTASNGPSKFPLPVYIK